MRLLLQTVLEHPVLEAPSTMMPLNQRLFLQNTSTRDSESPETHFARKVNSNWVLSVSGASLSGVGDGAESTIVKTNSISKGNQREQAPIVENNAGNVNKNEEAIDWSPIVTCYALLDDIQYKMGKIEENFDAIAS